MANCSETDKRFAPGRTSSRPRRTRSPDLSGLSYNTYVVMATHQLVKPAQDPFRDQFPRAGS